ARQPGRVLGHPLRRRRPGAPHARLQPRPEGDPVTLALADNLSGPPEFFWVTGPAAALPAHRARGAEILFSDRVGNTDAAVYPSNGDKLAEWRTEACDAKSDDVLRTVTGASIAI